MRTRFFRSPRYRRLKGKLVVVAAALCILLVIFAVHRTLHPFQSLNPLYHEVTVGEKVIDNWTYNGKNAQGYLVFYNKGEQVHLLPPNARELALDGRYVQIESATDNSLTYADPAVTLSWLWLVMGMGVCGLVILLFLPKRRRKWRVQRAYYPSVIGRGMWLRKIKLFFKYR